MKIEMSVKTITLGDRHGDKRRLLKVHKGGRQPTDEAFLKLVRDVQQVVGEMSDGTRTLGYGDAMDLVERCFPESAVEYLMAQKLASPGAAEEVLSLSIDANNAPSLEDELKKLLGLEP